MGQGSPLAIFPPHGIWITKRDKLKISAFNSHASVELTCHARLVTLNGEIFDVSFSLTPTTNRAFSSAYTSLSDGWLVSVTLVPNVITLHHGMCFARVSVTSGIETQYDDRIILCQDYISSTSYLAWPGGQIRNALQSDGRVVVDTPADPAIGSQFVWVAPDNTVVLPISVSFTLTTDATIANRKFVLQLEDSDNHVVAMAPNTNAVTASSSATCHWMRDSVNYSNTTVDYLSLMPYMHLPPSGRIRSAVQSLQAGDQISGIHIHYMEWIDE